LEGHVRRRWEAYGKETGTKEDNQKTNGAQNLACVVTRCGAETQADAGSLRQDHAHRVRQLRSSSHEGVVRDRAGLDVQTELSHAGGEDYLFTYSDKGGGGIRSNNPPELPGSVPYVHVPDARAAFEMALREGAEALMAPERVMEGVTIAVVRAPGGVPIGFSGP
jgi:uncharacterized protein